MGWNKKTRIWQRTLAVALTVGSWQASTFAAAPVVEELEAPAALATESPVAGDGERRDIPKNAQVEIIQERYANRAIKIERQVTQDTDGNYVNHGSWTMFDEKGRMLATGEFRNGVRHGAWTRMYAVNEGEMFSAPLYKQFQSPFIAEATFNDGKLHGTWIVHDSKKRKCSEWTFENGERHGKSLTYYPSGNKMTEAEYKSGQLEGESLEWNNEGKLVQKDTFVQGRKLAAKIDYYAPGVKRFEGVYLHARQILNTNYDFWNGVVKVNLTGKEGNDQRHGQWSSWYRNGQKQLEGRYHEDAPVGKFVWWHSNGQKAIEGEYITGKQSGAWVWWHQTGQKNISGEYVQGNPINKWTWWREDGKVTKVADMSVEKDAAPIVSNEAPSELQKEVLAPGPTLQATPTALPEVRFRR